MHIRSLLVAVAICLSLQVMGQKEASDAQIKELITLRGGTESYLSTIDIMVEQFSRNYPDVKQEVWLEVRRELAIKYLDKYLEALIPVYRKHFTAKEIKELIVFYKSPVGKKTVEKGAVLATESMKATLTWNKDVGAMIAEKIGVPEPEK